MLCMDKVSLFFNLFFNCFHVVHGQCPFLSQHLNCFMLCMDNIFIFFQPPLLIVFMLYMDKVHFFLNILTVSCCAWTKCFSFSTSSLNCFHVVHGQSPFLSQHLNCFMLCMDKVFFFFNLFSELFSCCTWTKSISFSTS